MACEGVFPPPPRPPARPIWTPETPAPSPRRTAGCCGCEKVFNIYLVVSTFIPTVPKTRANGVGARLHQHALQHPRARRATMQLFGKSADPKEQMRKWKKEMRGEQRKVDRQINRAHPPDLSPPRAVPTCA